jgi:hypothetical protein
MITVGILNSLITQSLSSPALVCRSRSPRMLLEADANQMFVYQMYVYPIFNHDHVL